MSIEFSEIAATVAGFKKMSDMSYVGCNMDVVDQLSCLEIIDILLLVYNV